MTSIVAVNVVMAAATLVSCTTDPGSGASPGTRATSLSAAAPSAIAPGDVVRTSLDGLVGPFGTIEIDHVDVAVRSASAGMTVKADVRATALETIDSLQLDYCGPPLSFLSVDGSTLAVTLEDRRLHAPLHEPLAADTDFAFRLLTVMPPGDAAGDGVAQMAAGLLCR